MLNIELSNDPAIVLLGIYPKELKDYVHIQIYTQMFMALSIAGKKEIHKCPSTKEWINKR